MEFLLGTLLQMMIEKASVERLKGKSGKKKKKKREGEGEDQKEPVRWDGAEAAAVTI